MTARNATLAGVRLIGPDGVVVAPSGDVTVTYLTNSWAYTLSTPAVVPAVTLGPTYLTVVFPSADDGWILEPARAEDVFTEEPELLWSRVLER